MGVNINMTIHKIFVSEHDEEKWLNSLGAKGYLLIKKSPCTYVFSKEDGISEYQIDYLDDTPKAPANQEYLEGKEVCGFKGNSAYIRNGVHTAETLKRQTARYGKLAAFFGVVTLLFGALFAYNLYYVNFFKSIDYIVPADSSAILPIFSFVVGKNPAQLFMWVVAPLLVIAGIFTVTFGREWLMWRKDHKAMSASDGGEEPSETDG